VKAITWSKAELPPLERSMYPLEPANDSGFRARSRQRSIDASTFAWIAFVICLFAMSCFYATTADADPNGRWQLKMFCSSKCHDGFEQGVIAYLSKHHPESEQTTTSTQKAVEIVVDYYFPGGDSINVYYVDQSKFTLNVLYESKGQPGCWRVKKYEDATSVIYVANFIFEQFTALSPSDRRCLDRIVISSESP
jgi:hypothetical protein